MNKEKFINALKKENIEISEEQLNKLEKYYKLLKETNKDYNLTRIIKEEEVYLKHFYDSLTIASFIPKEKIKLCDIGSGAGFPGIVLKIIFPNLDVTLIDSAGKKIEFLKLVIKELNLENIKALSVRAEEYQEKNREIFDIVTARAVAPLPILLEIASPLLKVNGLFISMKGKRGLEELKDAEKAIKILNLKVWEIKELRLPNGEGDRVIIALSKTGKLKLEYPRKYSQIKKKPL